MHTTIQRHISKREREVLELVAHEYTTLEIASRLYLSTHTVDSHKKKLKLKLNVKNTAGMVRRGFELGLLKLGATASYRMMSALLLALITIGQLSAQRPLILTFETSVPDEKVVIPVQPGFDYDYQVDWDGDGGFDETFTGEASHVYATPGAHKINITGDFPSIYFNNRSEASLLIAIDQWGDIKWQSMNNAFYGASKMKYLATDEPNLSTVSNMSGIFRACSSFDGDLSGWDVSTITSMSFAFLDATLFNGNVSTWDTRNVEFMGSVFDGATSFNQNISQWDLSNVVNTSGMFQDATEFNQPVGDWDVSMVGNMASMFRGATSFN